MAFEYLSGNNASLWAVLTWQKHEYNWHKFDSVAIQFFQYIDMSLFSSNFFFTRRNMEDRIQSHARPPVTRKRSKHCDELAYELPTICLLHQDGLTPLIAFLAALRK